MRKKFLALAPVGALTLAAVLAVPSGPALACSPDSYLGSVCYTAAYFCPAGMRQLNVPNAKLPMIQYQVLFAVIGTIYGGDGISTVGLPKIDGRTLAGAGTGTSPALAPAKVGTYRGSDAPQTISLSQMPPHSHDATFNVTFTGGAPSLTWQAATSGAASAVPSSANSYVAAISPATNMWSQALNMPVTLQGTSVAVSGGFASGIVTNSGTGLGQAFDARAPGIVVTACMPTDDYNYPPRP